MKLHFSEWVALISLLVTVIVVIRDLILSVKVYKLERLQFNYEYKLKCYTDLISLYQRADFIPDTEAGERLIYLVSEAQLICSNSTYNALSRLASAYRKGPGSQDFIDAYSLCVSEIRKELLSEQLPGHHCS